MSYHQHLSLVYSDFFRAIMISNVIHYSLSVLSRRHTTSNMQLNTSMISWNLAHPATAGVEQRICFLSVIGMGEDN